MKRTIALIALLLLLYRARAQGVEHLTLHDALALGLEHNPAITATRYAEQSAHRERQAAIGLFMPQVTLRGGYAHLNKDISLDLNPMLASLSPILGEGLSALGLNLSYPLQNRNTAFLGGDVVVPIFAGGKVWTANRVAKIEYERTKEQSAQVRGRLVVEIVERYFGVELARRGVAICEEAVAVVGAHLHDLLILEREGMAVESERLYAEYRLAEVERDLQRARLKFDTANKALQTSLGAEYRVVPSTPLFVLGSIETLDYFRAQALLRNPQLGEVGAVRDLAQANLRLRQAELMPEVVAMGAMNFCNYKLSPLVPRMAVGVGLNFKIFDGLRSEYRTASARLQLRQVEALERKAERDIVLLVEDLYNKVEAVLATTSAVERAEEFATEYLRAKQQAFREGMATTTDVVDAVLNLSRVRFERAQMAFDFDLALARLLEASGMGESFEQYSYRPSAKLIF